MIEREMFGGLEYRPVRSLGLQSYHKEGGSARVTNQSILLDTSHIFVSQQVLSLIYKHSLQK